MFSLTISYGGMIEITSAEIPVSAGDANKPYEHKFRTRTSEYPEIFPVLR
jgi:hypothetical protein